MSAAVLVYGVRATLMDVCYFGMDNPSEWEKIQNNWVIPNSRFDDDFIIGVPCYEAYRGEPNEIQPFNKPGKEILDSLQEVLKRLYIMKKPTWILMCE